MHRPRLIGLTTWLALAAAASGAVPGAAALEDRSGEGEPAFRELYRELVETDTTLSSGSCTLAAERMAARLKAAGYRDHELRVFSVPEHPQEGGLVAELEGSDAQRKPILLLAHIDVVEAKRADWVRDPFTLIEEDGYFYGRGTADDKAMAAVFTDLLIRYRLEGYHPKRTIRLALTCGEETMSAFNGAKYLATQHKDWIDAEFAINEGGPALLDARGRHQSLGVEAAEKVYQDFQLETNHSGGHSSMPLPDNAIYRMAAALQRIAALEFPVQLNDITRTFFTKMAAITGGEMGAAMQAIVRDPADARADATLAANKRWHATLRTTCVATLIDGGHAPNALPQRVRANVNCRVLPGVPIESVRDVLVQAIGDPQVQLTIREPRSIATPVPPLSLAVLGPVEQVAAELFPGVPVLPMMVTGASDGIHLTAAGIPTYGITALFSDPDSGNVHGLNERIRVRSLLDGRRFHYRLIKLYSSR
ncbi:MAG: M20/M25/M40 family metallo-hydrolase [Gammaproteobacteria bacterium]|nr:M20/M25/M40 family metallo-hydrolase [Gammaproteobacteria bacterium]